MQYNISSNGKSQSNSGFNRTGRPTWWALSGDTFLKIPYTRGDSALDVTITTDKPLVGDVKIGVGKAGRGKAHDAVRLTVTPTLVSE